MNPSRRSVDALEWLLSPVSASDFLSQQWEVAPKLIRRKDHAYYDALTTGTGSTPEQIPLSAKEAQGCLFSHERLLQLLREKGPLPYEGTMRVVRANLAEGHERVEAEPPLDGLVTAEWITTKFGQGYTVQLFRPQVHCDRLWSLLAALETRFDCLVGASIYLTPSGCQGLAPHYDDVEVLVLQTEGTKHWRVYAPQPGSDLPADPSADLPREVLGPLVLDVTLHAGDLLYLPRGFVHEASCNKKRRSTHVTVSTYQRHAYADLLDALLPRLLSSAIVDSRDLRRGLPLGFLRSIGSYCARVGSTMPRASGVPSLDGMTGIVQGLLANLVRAATPLAVGEAADRLGTDFFCNRLPPPSVATCTLPLPTIEDEVELLLCPPQHRRLVYVDRRVRTGGIISTGHDVLEDHEAKATLDLKEEDALEADTDGPLAYLQLQHCLQNRREQHMALPRGDPMAEACGPKGLLLMPC